MLTVLADSPVAADPDSLAIDAKLMWTNAKCCLVQTAVVASIR